MCVHRLRSSASPFAALALCAFVTSSACGSSDADSDGSRAGAQAGSGEGGDSASGGDGFGGALAGTSGAGGDAAGAGECPLDASARERAEAIVTQAVSEAGWITGQTHGTGEFASRGFGFAVPLTGVSSIVSITLVEQCTGPKAFEEYCDMSVPDPIATPCSRLECLSAAELVSSLWFEPMPFTAPADPEPGEIEVVTAEQSVTFVDQEDDSVGIQWSTDLELVPEGEDAISVAESGTATARPVSEESQAEGTITIAGLTARGDLVVEYVKSFEDQSGAGEVDGEQVFSVTHDGLVWSDACSAP